MAIIKYRFKLNDAMINFDYYSDDAYLDEHGFYMLDADRKKRRFDESLLVMKSSKPRKGQRVKGICIKEYFDEDDLNDLLNGKIEESDIRKYKVGDRADIRFGLYDPKFWRMVE